MAREAAEEIGVVSTTFRPIGTIADPNATAVDPVTYHMYLVEAWNGSELFVLGDEHSELRWFGLRAASSLRDLALSKYRGVFREALGAPPQ